MLELKSWWLVPQSGPPYVCPKCSPLPFSIQVEPFMISFLTGPRVNPAEPARVAAPNQTSPKDISHSPCLCLLAQPTALSSPTAAPLPQECSGNISSIIVISLLLLRVEKVRQGTDTV